jgi:hypothetical protein
MKNHVRQKTTGLNQKKDFVDTYFFLFLLYSTIDIKEFYKLRWGNGQLYPTPGSAHVTESGSLDFRMHDMCAANCGGAVRSVDGSRHLFFYLLKL